MRTVEVALIEWPNGPENGGPRLLARSSDPLLIAVARERIAAQRRRELEQLEGTSLREAGKPHGDPEAS